MEASRTKHDQGPPWWRSTRYLIAVFACLGYCNLYAQRVNLSVAIVCMVNHTAVSESELQDHVQQRSRPNRSSSDPNTTSSKLNNRTWDTVSVSTVSGNLARDATVEETTIGPVEDCETKSLSAEKSEEGELVWDKGTQGVVLGAFYWGYALLQLPSQRLIQRLHTKRATMWTMLLISTTSTLGPLTARIHPWLFIVTRIINGLGTAICFPAIYSVWGKWAPVNERTTLISICCSGSYLANAIVFPTSSLLCSYGFAGGWPSVFYVYAVTGFLWSIAWFFIFYDTPKSHPWIHPEETKYITQNSEPSKNENQVAVPWLNILTSLPVWAMIIAQFGYNWSTFLFMSLLPQYMREVLKLDIQSNGIYSMIPQIALFMTVIFWGAFSNWSIKRKALSTIGVRKLSTSIGDVIPATAFIAVSFLNCNDHLAVIVLMTCAIGISGTNLQGFMCNPYDIGAPYATAIFSFSNTLAVISGIISPYFVTTLTRDGTREQWQVVFFVTAALLLFCMLFFLLFGSANEMRWVTESRKNITVINGQEDSPLNYEMPIPDRDSQNEANVYLKDALDLTDYEKSKMSTSLS